MDHVVPVARGGTSTRGNVVPACRACNAAKKLETPAESLMRELEEKTGAEIIFWAGSCFGACDIPVGLEKLGVDMIIQFGHSGWRPRLEGYEYR